MLASFLPVKSVTLSRSLFKPAQNTAHTSRHLKNQTTSGNQSMQHRSRNILGQDVSQVLGTLNFHQINHLLAHKLMLELESELDMLHLRPNPFQYALVGRLRVSKQGDLIT